MQGWEIALIVIGVVVLIILLIFISNIRIVQIGRAHV